MAKKILFALVVLIHSSAFAQDKFIKDIDFDGQNDTVYINQNEGKIVCRLSSQNFK